MEIVRFGKRKPLTLQSISRSSHPVMAHSNWDNYLQIGIDITSFIKAVNPVVSCIHWNNGNYMTLKVHLEWFFRDWSFSSFNFQELFLRTIHSQQCFSTKIELLFPGVIVVNIYSYNFTWILSLRRHEIKVRL